MEVSYCCKSPESILKKGLIGNRCASGNAVLVGEQHGRKSGNVGGQHKGNRRARRGDFLIFFPTGFPGRSIWTKLPPITLVLLGDGGFLCLQLQTKQGVQHPTALGQWLGGRRG